MVDDGTRETCLHALQRAGAWADEWIVARVGESLVDRDFDEQHDNIYARNLATNWVSRKENDGYYPLLLFHIPQK